MGAVDVPATLGDGAVRETGAMAVGFDAETAFASMMDH